MQHRNVVKRSPILAGIPPTRLLTTPPSTSMFVFRQTYAGMPVDGANVNLDAVRRLRLQLECSKATAHSCDSDRDDELSGMQEEDGPHEAEDEYDDNSIVVKHAGQRLLPVLHLRCRWRKPAGRSRLMVLCLKLRQKVLKRASKLIGKFRRAKQFLLH
ncbi:hypothetical protein NMY22_g8393 [Coprinellus aureogranulatus]|nr:hypothetical protein NMY22_g8393 [Coprinellus aureogranulatus]